MPFVKEIACLSLKKKVKARIHIMAEVTETCCSLDETVIAEVSVEAIPQRINC